MNWSRHNQARYCRSSRESCAASSNRPVSHHSYPPSAQVPPATHKPYQTMPRSDEAQAFFHAVYSAVQEIPPGKVTSYGHIAKLVGTRTSAPQYSYSYHTNLFLFSYHQGSLLTKSNSPAPPPSRRLPQAPARQHGSPGTLPQRQCALAARHQCQGDDLATVATIRSP